MNRPVRYITLDDDHRTPQKHELVNRMSVRRNNRTGQSQQKNNSSEAILHRQPLAHRKEVGINYSRSVQVRAGANDVNEREGKLLALRSEKVDKLKGLYALKNKYRTTIDRDKFVGKPKINSFTEEPSRRASQPATNKAKSRPIFNKREDFHYGS